MKLRTLSIIAGISYWVIFFAAIFANFFVLESIMESPLEMIEHNRFMVGLGVMAFMITVLFDVVVAWALYEMYREHHLSRLSTYFRIVHAIIMGVALAALPLTFSVSSDGEVLRLVDIFNTVWLIGLFFFGFHLILLGKIAEAPKIIAIFLVIAGVMYMADTTAHFLMPNYDVYGSLFLAFVAIPSILGEMSFAVWLLVKGGKRSPKNLGAMIR
ncbi:DUF4386 domain-containing protein [Echinicola sp. CAU 1574]|uniref:DUF4386 domain-containing protein n=1 Tax=Echinicola arenosa TaxID=2774144 RepID=A0ABR9AGS9_9BACT|nr:DUF4386 domain-containing protein [Echinicola arenosa]MBD8487461.1 DUF4386 domain-containing protein [Echinicola arenosa]